MILKVLLFITTFTPISSQIVNCNFINSNYVVNFHNVNQYGCNVTTINSNSLQSDITGRHHNNHDNSDVLFISYAATNIKSLPKISQIFCQKFQNLEKIDFSQSKIDLIDEDSFTGCEELLELTLTNNKIRKIPENLFAGNSKLKKIDLGTNQLTTLPENVFANQVDLELLDLRINLINSLPPRIFEPLENLRGLWLGENKIRTINPVWFENLQNLEELRLHSNRLTELNAGVFKSLTNLQGLYLGFNRIKTLTPDCFQNLQNLEILSMGSNLITELPISLFTPTINLRELWLHWNQLTVIHSDSFTSNKNLKSFAVQNNKINQIDKKFIDMTGVTEVNMENNVCSKEFIRNRGELSRKLSVCFGNYQPRSGGVPQVTSNIQSYTQKPASPIIPLELNQHAAKPSTQQSCGKSKVGQGQIIGGKHTTRGAYPWVAALVYSKDGKFFCGGTIVSSQKILTAAHCIQEKYSISILRQSELKVLLGTHNLNEHYEVGRKIAVVQKIHIHNDWNPHTTSFDSDVAVLVLERKITFDNYVQPICMGSDIEYLTNGLVVGYGKSEDETKDHENIAKMLEAPIHKNEDCFFVNRELTTISSKKTFCAGTGSGQGVCSGDSGSGLIVKHNGFYYLRGIVSSSLKNGKYGCDVNSYAVFTDVLKFMDWINKIDVDGNFYSSRF